MNAIWITVIFALAFAVMVYMLRYAALWWPVKAVACVSVVGMGVGFWFALTALLGYPVASDKTEMRYISSFVVEPSEKGPGAIFIWAKEGDAPRAYTFPYSKGLHEQVERAQKASGVGRPPKLRKNADRSKWLGTPQYDALDLDAAVPTKE